jgi:hypothetical protein
MSGLAPFVPLAEAAFAHAADVKVKATPLERRVLPPLAVVRGSQPRPAHAQREQLQALPGLTA